MKKIIAMSLVTALCAIALTGCDTENLFKLNTVNKAENDLKLVTYQCPFYDFFYQLPEGFTENDSWQDYDEYCRCEYIYDDYEESGWRSDRSYTVGVSEQCLMLYFSDNVARSASRVILGLLSEEQRDEMMAELQYQHNQREDIYGIYDSYKLILEKIQEYDLPQNVHIKVSPDIASFNNDHHFFEFKLEKNTMTITWDNKDEDFPTHVIYKMVDSGNFIKSLSYEVSYSLNPGHSNDDEDDMNKNITTEISTAKKVLDKFN